MYQRILLTLDLVHPDTQTRAVTAAVDLARAFGATLHVLTVVPDFGMSLVGGFFPKGFERKAREEARKALHAFTAARIPADVTLQHVVGHGTIYEEILRVAGEVRADLIVMASHRPELADYLLGPNAARVVRHATVSVLVVRPPPGEPA